MLKRPLSYTDQIKQLKSHGMIIEDETIAQAFLKVTNDYRFTGYALQFRKAPNNSDFIEGTSFDAVMSLYCFDEELRDCLRKYIEASEIYYKTVISHEFSMEKCIDPPYEQHYDENNYYNKQWFNDLKDHFD